MCVFTRMYLIDKLRQADNGEWSIKYTMKENTVWEFCFWRVFNIWHCFKRHLFSLPYICGHHLWHLETSIMTGFLFQPLWDFTKHDLTYLVTAHLKKQALTIWQKPNISVLVYDENFLFTPEFNVRFKKRKNHIRCRRIFYLIFRGSVLKDVLDIKKNGTKELICRTLLYKV